MACSTYGVARTTAIQPPSSSRWFRRVLLDSCTLGRRAWANIGGLKCSDVRFRHADPRQKRYVQRLLLSLSNSLPLTPCQTPSLSLPVKFPPSPSPVKFPPSHPLSNSLPLIPSQTPSPSPVKLGHFPDRRATLIERCFPVDRVRVIQVRTRSGSGSDGDVSPTPGFWTPSPFWSTGIGRPPTSFSRLRRSCRAHLWCSRRLDTTTRSGFGKPPAESATVHSNTPSRCVSEDEGQANWRTGS